MLRVFAFILCLFFSIETYAETVITDSIDSDQTWTETESPYIIDENIKIKKNVTLTINEGVSVISNYKEIEIIGKLIISGSLEKRVNIEKLKINVNSDENKDSGSFEISFAHLNNSSLLGTSHELNSYVFVTDSIIENNRSGIKLWGCDKSVLFKRNIFLNFGGFITDEVKNAIIIENNVFFGLRRKIAVNHLLIEKGSKGSVEVHYNSFFDDGEDNHFVSLSEHFPGTNLSATNNYWGTTDKSLIQDMIYDKNDNDKIHHSIDFEPILTDHHAETPVDLMTFIEIKNFTVKGIKKVNYELSFSFNIETQNGYKVKKCEIDFGDGTSKEVNDYSNISHTYYTPGSYLAKVIVEDTNGRTNNQVLHIEISDTNSQDIVNLTKELCKENPSECGIDIFIINKEKIESLEKGWTLLGAPVLIENLDIFKSAAIIWVHQGGSFLGYSPEESMRTKIINSGYGLIDSIEKGSGIWILKE